MAGAFERVHLALQSTIDVLDRVQQVTEEIGHRLGFDEEAVHWTSMAVRETVINAITHGNKSNPAKLVFLDFEVEANGTSRDLVVCVRDQGAGFDPGSLGDPLAPENILNTSGRGIFLARQFMDDVSISRAREGGMKVRMLKHL
jgi:serine/threonine-protein kinase RsbW